MSDTKAVRTRFEHANPILHVANLFKIIVGFSGVLGGSRRSRVVRRIGLISVSSSSRRAWPRMPRSRKGR